MSLDSNISIGAKETASQAMLRISKSAADLSQQMGKVGAKAGEVRGAMAPLDSLAARIAAAHAQAGRGMHKMGQDADYLRGKMNMVGAASKGLMAAMAPLLAVFAAVRVVQGFASTMGEASEAYLVQEKAIIGATDEQRNYANAMQRVLGVGDEVTLQMTRQAEAMGVSKESAQEAATAALGLAKATGTESKEALKKVSQALQGNLNAMAESVPAIRNLTTEEEKWAAVNEVINRGLQMQKDEMDGVQGVVTRANNSWGDLLEVIGNLLAPMRAIVNQGIAVFAETMQTVLVPAVNLANRALENLPAIFATVNRVIVGGITAVEVVLTNLPEVSQLVVTRLALGWETLKQDALQIFTVTLPAIANWFKDNWGNLLFDAFTAVVTYYKNRFIQMKDLFVAGFQATLDVAEWAAMNLPKILYNAGVEVLNTVSGWVQSLGQIFQKAWDTITGYWTGATTDIGADLQANLQALTADAVAVLAAPPKSLQDHAATFGKILSRNMLEGWESTTEPLPDLLGRQLSDREKDLMQKVSEIAGGLGDEFASKFGERMAAVDEAFADFTGKANLSADMATEALSKAAGTGASLTASEGRLSTRGAGDDPVEKIARLNEQANSWLQRIFEKQQPDTTVEVVEAIA